MQYKTYKMLEEDVKIQKASELDKRISKFENENVEILNELFKEIEVGIKSKNSYIHFQVKKDSLELFYYLKDKGFNYKRKRYEEDPQTEYLLIYLPT